MAERGFVKDLNFREITREGQANNLLVNLTRIDGITADVKLFSNNFNNTSRLPKSIGGEDLYVTQQDSSGEYLVVIDINGVADGYVPYSNRTLLYEELVEISGDVEVRTRRTFTQEEETALVLANIIGLGEAVGREMQLYVYESNTVDRFKVRDQYGINRDVSGDLVRPDIITASNIRNMAVDREDTITDAIVVDTDSGGSSTGEIGYISAPIASNYSEIDNGLSMYTYKKSRLILGYEETFLRKQALVNGYINITNPDNISVIDPEANPPGLYIRPPTGGNPIRAFSDTSNPWARNNETGRLETTASKITAQTLILNNPNLQPSNSADQHQIPTDSDGNPVTLTLDGNSGDRYKIKVEINGVPYFLFALEDV